MAMNVQEVCETKRTSRLGRDVYRVSKVFRKTVTRSSRQLEERLMTFRTQWLLNEEARQRFGKYQAFWCRFARFARFATLALTGL